MNPHQYNILIVDDDPLFLDGTKALLAKSLPGAQVKTALSATEGLKTIRSARVDLLLVDYRMPEMDGQEFMAEAQRMNPRIPRAILTAYPSKDLRQWADAEGNAHGFLTKDMAPDELVAQVKALLATTATHVRI